MFSRDHLHASLAKLGVSDPGDIFAELHSAYTSADRHYHSDKHVAECLGYFDRYASLAQHPAEIEVAIWFHDAIYDTHRSDNEEQSAAWAARYLQYNQVAPERVQRIEAVIIATKTHVADSDDAALMLGIDLGILGTSPAVFERYDTAIRKEYHWVPEADYRSGRAAVLQSFLQRERIYTTPTFFERLEQQARHNLQTKVDELLQ